MNENSLTLAPTLWRTFRVIASGIRLRCLKVVLKTPECSVEQVAEAVGISEIQSSLALRALQSRGLLASKRQSRWVLYAPDPDVSVMAAKAFLSAMKTALLDSRIDASRIVNAAKAYTHPRRIDIVRAIAQAGETQNPARARVAVDRSGLSPTRFATLSGSLPWHFQRKMRERRRSRTAIGNVSWCPGRESNPHGVASKGF